MSAKDIYEAKVYAANMYAAGVFRGVGASVGNPKYPTSGTFSRSDNTGTFERSETIGTFERQA